MRVFFAFVENYQPKTFFCCVGASDVVDIEVTERCVDTRTKFLFEFVCPQRFARVQNPPASRVLGCFGLSQRTTERDLKHCFRDYGPIEKIMLITDRKV